jgi:hypothetical protein
MAKFIGVTAGMKSLTCLSLIRKAEFSSRLIDQVDAFQKNGFVLIRAANDNDLLEKTKNLNLEILRSVLPLHL